VVAAVGDFTRFRTPERLVAYLGLHPRVRQSGGQPASHGRITKAGSAHARGMLVEAAWSAARTPGGVAGLLSAGGEPAGCTGRGGGHRPHAASQLVVVCWHLVNSGQDYGYARPSLVARKRRTLELRAGARSARGYGGKSSRSSPAAVRDGRA